MTSWGHSTVYYPFIKCFHVELKCNMYKIVATRRKLQRNHYSKCSTPYYCTGVMHNLISLGNGGQSLSVPFTTFAMTIPLETNLNATIYWMHLLQHCQTPYVPWHFRDVVIKSHVAHAQSHAHPWKWWRMCWNSTRLCYVKKVDMSHSNAPAVSKWRVLLQLSLQQ